MEVHIPNSRGHAKAWESISPTREAMPKRGSPYPQLKGPRQSVGVQIPNSRGHAKAWESISPTRGATPKRGSPYPQLEGPPTLRTEPCAGFIILPRKVNEACKTQVTPVLLGVPNQGTESKLATSPLPSRGPKRGQNGDITPAFLGSPIWGLNQNWLPHPCLLGGPKEGGMAA